MRKVFFAGMLFFLFQAAQPPARAQTQAQDALRIDAEDLRIEQRAEGGFHLFVRKKPGMGSVLLVESTRDPTFQEANYAYCAPEWNAVNGDEIRMIDGRPIPRSERIYSLVDSTPEVDIAMGEAFHIYIPDIIIYGNENTRHGEVYVVDGTYINIRSFALPYADYRGAFRDNPFILKVMQTPIEGPPGGTFLNDTREAFGEIAKTGGGDLLYALGPDDLAEKIRGALEKERGRTVDLVLCLDTTSSMKDDIDAVRGALVPMLRGIMSQFRSFRIGMVLYRDYYDEYLTKVIPFTTDFSAFQTQLNSVKTGGGRDIPEAVYEALYEAAIKFEWQSESRLIILAGDAPPHKRQLGMVSKDMVDAEARKRGIKITAIMLPQ
ncbi:MAG: VWA domain-containing protein [Treponema sp.]|jgi:hypothetical protein|nr:VWA domain-containing protein [Treponema sp.]